MKKFSIVIILALCACQQKTSEPKSLVIDESLKIELMKSLYSNYDVDNTISKWKLSKEEYLKNFDVKINTDSAIVEPKLVDILVHKEEENKYFALLKIHQNLGSMAEQYYYIDCVQFSKKKKIDIISQKTIYTGSLRYSAKIESIDTIFFGKSDSGTKNTGFQLIINRGTGKNIILIAYLNNEFKVVLDDIIYRDNARDCLATIEGKVYAVNWDWENKILLTKEELDYWSPDCYREEGKLQFIFSDKPFNEIKIDYQKTIFDSTNNTEQYSYHYNFIDNAYKKVVNK